MVDQEGGEVRRLPGAPVNSEKTIGSQPTAAQRASLATQAGTGAGGVTDGVDGESGCLGLAIVEGHALDVVEDRGAEVVDRYGFGHVTSVNW